jgi:plastocyanin
MAPRTYRGRASSTSNPTIFYFEPTLLTGTAGQTVTIELENEGDAEHNFSLPDQAVDQDVESGQKAQVEVTFPDSGTLVFFCKYHQNMGMRGGAPSR